ncbi:MAG: carbohydrate ABC transporter permease [Chloroflexi bacterium]|nr:carbohydrate ABC transporter permease [Chloroflexota bacterium]
MGQVGQARVLSSPALPQAVPRRSSAFRRNLPRAVVYGLLAVGGFIFALPLLWLFSTSLKMPGHEFVLPPEWIPNPVRLENYTEAFRVRPFALFTRNTMVILILATAGTLITGSMSAYAFARLRFPGRGILFGITLSTLMLPFVVTMVPTFILFKQLKWINTFAPLIVPYWAGGGAFNIFLMRQFFMTIPYELEEAARIDGAGFFRSYWQITLPLAGPVLATVGIFSFIHHWNDFLAPLIYLSSPYLQTLALGIQTFRGEFGNQWNLLMAASAAMVVPVLLMFFFAQRYFLRGVAMTGLAGR